MGRTAPVSSNRGGSTRSQMNVSHSLTDQAAYRSDDSTRVRRPGRRTAAPASPMRRGVDTARVADQRMPVGQQYLPVAMRRAVELAPEQRSLGSQAQPQQGRERTDTVAPRQLL